MNSPHEKTEYAIEVQNLSMRFGQDTVLKNVSCKLQAGQIHGLIGRNGSGKTVLMKCILGFLRPSSGEAKVFGKRIGQDVDFAPDTGMLIESPGFLPNESGISNLKWLARLGNQAKAADIRKAIETVGLDPNMKKPVGKYSLGMRQRLGIAQAIMESPRLLVLDEPMNGLDKQGVADMKTLLKSFQEQGKTILLASHFSLDIEELCDTVHEIDQGHMTRLV
ncbi:MAG: ABC transporter ATP-binding protein [Christensenellales bacterium]|jgi:ABC-2 type transport system ATP-binding protein